MASGHDFGKKNVILFVYHSALRGIFGVNLRRGSLCHLDKVFPSSRSESRERSTVGTAISVFGGFMLANVSMASRSGLTCRSSE